MMMICALCDNGDAKRVNLIDMHFPPRGEDQKRLDLCKECFDRISAAIDMTVGELFEKWYADSHGMAVEEVRAQRQQAIEEAKLWEQECGST